MYYLNKLLDISGRIVNETKKLVQGITEVTIYNGPTSFKVNQDMVMANPTGYADAVRRFNFLIGRLNTATNEVITKRIEKIRDLLRYENNILNDIDKDEVKEYLSKLDEFNGSKDDDVIARIRDRLNARSCILEGSSIKVDKILQCSFLDDMKFYDKELFPCLIKIEVFKKLRDKIDTLKGDYNFWFVRGLYREYEILKFNTMKDNALMEFIGFYYNTDMGKIPELDIDIDIDMDSIMELCEGNVEYSLCDYVIEKAYDAIDVIASIDPTNNDVTEAFELLYNFTLVEVLISYMDIEDLEDLKRHCDSESNNISGPCIKLVRSMIKRNEDIKEELDFDY